MAAVAGPYAPRHSISSPRRASTHAPHARKPTYVSTTAPLGVGVPDPFYGHEEVSKTCARFITALFSCPDLPPTNAAAASGTTGAPPPPPPPLSQFIGYALHRTRLHSCVTFTALFLLSRLKARFPAARGSSGHRLFISAFMIASKVVCDDTYSNKSWCVVGQGMFSLKEINQMEREMCGYLEWQLNFPPNELTEFEAKVRKEYGRDGRGARLPSLSINTSAPPAAVVSRYPASKGHSTGLPSPPPSPPATPDSDHSESPSPASAGVQTPPSALSDDTASIASSATSMSIHGHSFPGGDRAATVASPPHAAPSKGAAREGGFAFAVPAVW